MYLCLIPLRFSSATREFIAATVSLIYALHLRMQISVAKNDERLSRILLAIYDVAENKGKRQREKGKLAREIGRVERKRGISNCRERAPPFPPENKYVRPDRISTLVRYHS